MARFESDQLDEIRSRVDIVDFIGRYVGLKPAGRNHIGLCPFHQEKTPSFHVHRERQFFHCFGCKESGDVFEFVMKHERLTFPEAVQRLGKEAGVSLPEPDDMPARTQQKRKEDLYYRANSIAAQYFGQTLRLPAARGAISYLRQRGIEGKTARHFQVGYALSHWDDLLKHLKANGIPGDVAVATGLALQREGREPFDLFRNRIIFPITDTRGRVVGFGGRALHGDNPKYINTPQTDVFSKREHLYGLTQAQAAARKEDFLIVCEGYTDVIALAQSGIHNSVASLGTAFTAEQARTLSRWSKEVVLAFDADLAGRSATDRGLDLLSEAGLVVRVAMLPEGEDPDSLVRLQGKEAFLQLLESALPLTEYKIEEALRAEDLMSVEGRARAVASVLPVLASVESAVAQEGYVAKIAGRIGSSPQAIMAEIDQFLRRSGRRTGARHRIERSRYTTMDSSRGSPVSQGRAPITNAQRSPVRPTRMHTVDEKAVLWILVKEPEQIDWVYKVLGEEPFHLDEHNALFAALRSAGPSGQASDEEPSPKIVAAINELHSWEPAVVLDIDTYIDRLWAQQVRSRLHRLEVDLTRLPERDENAYAEHVGSLLLAYKRLRQAVRRHSTTK